MNTLEIDWKHSDGLPHGSGSVALSDDHFKNCIALVKWAQRMIVVLYPEKEQPEIMVKFTDTEIPANLKNDIR